MLNDLQNLKEPIYPVYDPDATPADRALKIALMREEVNVKLSGLIIKYTTWRELAMEKGEITEWPDPETVIGTRYQFTEVEVAELLIMYLSYLIAFNRTLYELSIMQGTPLGALNVQHRALSRQIWMCLKYMRDLGPISGTLFAQGLAISLEAGDEAEKRYVLETMLELDNYKQLLPRDLGELAEMVLLTARIHLGRATMGDLQRFSVRAR